MNSLKQTQIAGLLLIDTLALKDNRGKLIKPYSQHFFGEEMLHFKVKETWFTHSKKDVIRAMHMQIGPLSCQKYISVISGSVIDVVIDLRKDSPTFMNVVTNILDGSLPQALFVPADCAHGYRVLEEDTITMYMANEVHDEKNDIGIRWDSFGYDWGITTPILSAKDLILPTLADYLKVK